MFPAKRLRARLAFALGVLLAACLGCEQDMADRARLKPFEPNAFFEDGQSARQPVPGTVARGNLRTDTAFFEGRAEGRPVETFPQETVAQQLGLAVEGEQAMAAILHRGQQRYNIFCAPCHDRTGFGQGMVVQRGFPAPPSFHIQRLREAPVGEFYTIISKGFGRMPDYASQIPPADRWAIVAYVRALQLSQQADVNQLPASDREALQSQGPTE